MSHLGNTCNVQNVDLRVCDCFAEERFRVGAHGSLPGCEVVLVVDESDLNAEFGQGVLEEVVGSAIDRRGANNVVAGVRNVQNGVGGCRLAGAQQQSSCSALERCDALLCDILRRVHDAGVNVSKLREREQVCCVLSAIEHIRRRAIDRRCPRIRGRVGASTSVYLLGLKLPVVCHGHAFCLRTQGSELRGANSKATSVIRHLGV